MVDRRGHIQLGMPSVLKIAFRLLLGSVFLPTTAFACGGFLDIPCNLDNGGLSPANLAEQMRKAAQDAANAAAKAGQDTFNTAGKAGQDVADALNQLQANILSGPVLEQAILASRNSSANGSIPIPQQIRAQLAGYASEDSTNRVRYKIGDNGFANLAHLLEQGDMASAVTLVDVVIFRGPTEAADPSTWAHELTHVDQYRDRGVHGFAVQYVLNSRVLEDPAYSKGSGFRTWQQQNQNSVPVSVPIMPQNIGLFCYTAVGRFGPGPARLQGAPCVVTLQQGNFLGQVGP